MMKKRIFTTKNFNIYIKPQTQARYNMSKSRFNFLEKLKSDRKTRIFMIVVILSIIVVFMFFCLKNENGDQEQTYDEVGLYVSGLEDRLEKTLSEIDGVGKVSVVITVSSGMETVLAVKKTETEKNGVIEREETPILVNGKTVTVTEKYPEITGVLIVCEGAGNIITLSRIQNAVTSVLGVQLNKVEILARKK